VILLCGQENYKDTYFENRKNADTSIFPTDGTTLGSKGRHVTLVGILLENGAGIVDVKDNSGGRRCVGLREMDIRKLWGCCWIWAQILG
jgi:hypothetical protein